MVSQHTLNHRYLIICVDGKQLSSIVDYFSTGGMTMTEMTKCQCGKGPNLAENYLSLVLYQPKC